MNFLLLPDLAAMAMLLSILNFVRRRHPREAVEVYAEQVERLAVAGSASAYAEAAKLVARMAKLRSRTEQVTYVLELKVRHGRKRNFMKLLG